MIDAHIIEDIGRSTPATRANIAAIRGIDGAVEALADGAIVGGFAAVQGMTTIAASPLFASAIAALDSEAPGYPGALDYLTACQAACDAHGAPCTVWVSFI